MNNSSITHSDPHPKARGFWSRLGEAMEDVGLSYAERLERRVSCLETEVRLLKQQGTESPGRSNSESLLRQAESAGETQ